MSSVTIHLHYTPPFDWSFFLHYLQTRASVGVEAINGDRYSRTVAIGEARGVFEVTHQAAKSLLAVTVYGDVCQHADVIEARLVRMFDLEADMSAIHEVLIADAWLASQIRAWPGIRVPGAWSAFELLVRAIVGQQVSVPAASTIMGRIAARLGSPVETYGRQGLLVLFPTPQTVADSQLDKIGMPAKRVAALRNVARTIATGAIPFGDSGDFADGLKESLLTLPGIGPWTAEYFALRALRDSDAWPETDLVLRRSLAELTSSLSSAEACAVSERWKPWRAYAAMHLWNKASQAQKKAAKSRKHGKA
jgi:DNA-3-methyladenine glycosylase II